MILVSAIRLIEEKMFWFSQDTPWFVSLVTRTQALCWHNPKFMFPPKFS